MHTKTMEALDCIAHTDLDLAILDVMLPDADGFQICRKIREKSYFPIIMLTAKTADVDKITGLSVWTPYAMIGACVIEIPLFAFLAVRSYCRHALN